MTTQLFRLFETHQRIDAEIRRESSYRWPDLLRIVRLKRMKLAIKDRIAALTPILGNAR